MNSLTIIPMDWTWESKLDELEAFFELEERSAPPNDNHPSSSVPRSNAADPNHTLAEPSKSPDETVTMAKSSNIPPSKLKKNVFSFFPEKPSPATTTTSSKSNHGTSSRKKLPSTAPALERNFHPRPSNSTKKRRRRIKEESEEEDSTDDESLDAALIVKDVSEEKK